ncbi:MAG: hypothetical protein ACI9WS_001951 [Paraglaciecola psychrophila]|jgi:hypothetical protein
MVNWSGNPSYPTNFPPNFPHSPYKYLVAELSSAVNSRLDNIQINNQPIVRRQLCCPVSDNYDGRLGVVVFLGF